jgi:O-antigen ligase
MFMLSLIFYPAGLRPVAKVILLLGTALFLIKSGSKTSLGIIALAIPTAFALVKSRAILWRFAVPLALLLVPLIGLGWPLLWAPFHEAIYYDHAAFTGRGYIWAASIAYIRDHWLFGAGFGSFWSTGISSPVYQYSDNEWVRDAVFVGHSGYFDLLATVGVPGLLLVLWAVFIIPFAKVVASRSVSDRVASFSASVMIFCAGNNLTESTILNGDALLNVMLMLVIAMLYVRERHAKGIVPPPQSASSTPNVRPRPLPSVP